MSQVINSEIREILKENDIRYTDGLSYLLSLYYDCVSTFVPDIFKLKMLTTNIFEVTEKQGFVWNISLFEEQLTNFEWVKEYRDAFKQINPERAGDLNTCVLRFKRFFAKYPQYRVEDVKEAVNAYFRSVSSPKYLMKSQKFIFEGHINTGSSELLTWLERIGENSPDGRTSLTNTMK